MSQIAVGDVYNSTVAAWTISAAWELDAQDELSESGKLNIEKFVREKDLHPGSARDMTEAIVFELA